MTDRFCCHLPKLKTSFIFTSLQENSKLYFTEKCKQKKFELISSSSQFLSPVLFSPVFAVFKLRSVLSSVHEKICKEMKWFRNFFFINTLLGSQTQIFPHVFCLKQEFFSASHKISFSWKASFAIYAGNHFWLRNNLLFQMLTSFHFEFWNSVSKPC